jgi:hypothetical protein
MKDENEKGIKWWIRYVFVPLGVAIIGGGGLVSIAVAVIPYVFATPTPTQVTQAINTSVPVIRQTDTPAALMPTQIIMPTSTIEIIIPTPTLAPVIVDKGENQAGNTTHKRFDITLSAGESIVGQSWELITIQPSGQKIYAPCVAYLFEGSGQYSFSIIAGYWYRYQNVTPSIDESLLQGMVDSLVSQKCPSDVKIVHLP